MGSYINYIKNPVNDTVYQVHFYVDNFPTQCGMKLLCNISYMVGEYSRTEGGWKNTANGKNVLRLDSPEMLALHHELFKYLFVAKTEICDVRGRPLLSKSPFIHEYGYPLCARVLMSDVVGDRSGPHLTRYFCEANKGIEKLDPVKNPNSGNDVNLFYYDFPSQRIKKEAA